MEVEGLVPATDYIFTVSAYNDVGEGSMSTIKHVRTLDSGGFCVMKINQGGWKILVVIWSVVLYMSKHKNTGILKWLF